MVQALVGFDVNVARNLDALLDALMGIPLWWTCDMSILCFGVHAKTSGDSGLMGLGGRHHGQDRVKHAAMPQTIAQRPVTSRDLLMAYRWPAAVVLSSLVLAVTAAKLLSRPIPIAIKGGLQVDKLVLPPSVTIRSDTPLPVVVQEQVTIGGAAPLAIEGPVTISGNAPLAVEGAVSVTA